MRRAVNWARSIVSIILLVVAMTTTTASQSFAQWICTHGHSGHFQTPEKEPTEHHRFAWGLDLYVPPTNDSGYDWVHYTIPVSSENQYQSIRVDFYTTGGAFIRHVHVWSGRSKYQSLNNVYLGLNSPGWQSETLELDRPMRFWGSGISLLLQGTWVDQMYWGGRLIIARVCLGP